MIDDLINDTLKYAKTKGNNHFDIDRSTMCLFFAIVFVSDNVNLPRRPLYWENKADVYNEAVSNAMSRNKFG